MVKMESSISIIPETMTINYPNTLYIQKNWQSTTPATQNQDTNKNPLSSDTTEQLHQ